MGRAPKARSGLLPGPNSADIGTSPAAELGAWGAALRAAPLGLRTESWGADVLEVRAWDKASSRCLAHSACRLPLLDAVPLHRPGT
eukprot:8342719-Alexandrium_andersonii.AAC.1